LVQCARGAVTGVDADAVEAVVHANAGARAGCADWGGGIGAKKFGPAEDEEEIPALDDPSVVRLVNPSVVPPGPLPVAARHPTGSTRARTMGSTWKSR
jgi:hypothetical protein